MDVNEIVLLPRKKGTCRVCATVHAKNEPHARNSFYYMYRFYRHNKRFPTKEDARKDIPKDDDKGGDA